MSPFAPIARSMLAALVGLFAAMECGVAAFSNAPPGAISLFNGQDAVQWTTGAGTAAPWNVTNGVLTVVPGSGAIRTVQWFDDAQLHLEFRFLTNSPAGTSEGALHNSGVFFQNQFEVQIIESYNRAVVSVHDCASVYSIWGPAVDASVPSGTWETFDIFFRAPRWINGVKVENARLTVWWNGALAQDNVEVSRPTAAGAPPETPPPGPIGLQDLVGPVQFRNIWALPLTLPRAPEPESVTLVAAGSAWRYLDDGSNQTAAWRAPAFDDSGWSNGMAQFGYGDGDEVTLVRSNRSGGSRIETTYFRKPFVVSNMWSITNLVLGVLRDDGGIVYLNGAEIFRSNMTNASVAYTNWALVAAGGVDESRFFTANVKPSLLVEGTNWLAAEIHQQSATSSDLSFDLRLSALAWPNPTLAARPASDTIALQWPSSPPGFELQWAATLSPGADWSPETNTIIASSNGFNSTMVTLTNATRFYRLRRAL